ncbi:MAG: hypothetical protein Q8R11_03225 [bacterium]|nr:hypothetical protein [bacterium]
MNKNEVQPYLRRFLNEIDRLAMRKDNQEKAEHALLLSTVFQNAVVAGE